MMVSSARAASTSSQDWKVKSETMAITDPENPGNIGKNRNVPMAQSIQPGRFGHSGKPDDALLHDADRQLEAIQGLAAVNAEVVVKCPWSAPRAAAMARRRLWRGGGYGEVWARDPSAKTRDRMMEYVDEAMDD